MSGLLFLRKFYLITSHRVNLPATVRWGYLKNSKSNMKLQNSPKNSYFAELQQSSFYTVVENESVFKNRLCKCKEKTRISFNIMWFHVTWESFKYPNLTVINANVIEEELKVLFYKPDGETKDTIKIWDFFPCCSTCSMRSTFCMLYCSTCSIELSQK